MKKLLFFALAASCAMTAGAQSVFTEFTETSSWKGDYAAVDIDNDRPYPAAFEVLRRSRNELPYLSEFFIPSFEGVLEILNYPVITQFRSTSL